MPERLTSRLRKSELWPSLRNPQLLLWFGFIVAFPFYVMPSGLPQPSSVIAVLLMLLTLSTSFSFERATMPAVRCLMLFVGYVVLVNVMWSVALGRFTLSGRYGLLIHPTYYVYNAALCLTGLALAARFPRQFLVVTTYAAVASLLVQLVGSAFISGGTNHRGAMWFNSPNQLGYYAVLCASIVVFGAKRVRVSGWILASVFFASGYLAFLSMSRAAIIAVGVLAVLTVVSRPSAIVLALIVFIAAFVVFESSGGMFERSINRLQTISEKDPGRGYDRIVQHPEYWIMGAGEGALDRFPNTRLTLHELHSSLGTLFFSYGAVGTLLFAAFLFQIGRRGGLLSIAQMMPAALYGLAHQGLRFSLMWVMLTLLLAVKRPTRDKEPNWPELRPKSRPLETQPGLGV